MQTASGGENELGRFRLLVSGRIVALRQPGGAEDLLLTVAARTPGGDAALAMALVGRLARAVDGAPLDWGGMPVTDLDTVVLRLRQALIGDLIRADVACPAPACGHRMDIEFSIDDFLAHHAPQPAGTRDRDRNHRPADEPGWFCLAKAATSLGTSAADPADSADLEGVRFRLPTVDDLLATCGEPLAETALAVRCIQPLDAPEWMRRQAEDAMEMMAPSLSTDLQGVCPECADSVTVQFDARWYCLRELRDRAAFIYRDVDLLARRYHWSEAEILAMPHARRAAYAELARQEGGT